MPSKKLLNEAFDSGYPGLSNNVTLNSSLAVPSSPAGAPAQTVAILDINTSGAGLYQIQIRIGGQESFWRVINTVYQWNSLAGYTVLIRPRQVGNILTLEVRAKGSPTVATPAFTLEVRAFLYLPPF